MISLSSDGVDKDSIQPRESTGTDIELQSGNYVAGKDFDPGVYDITCISGYGNVYSSNSFNGGLNEVMSTDTSTGLAIISFRNASFEDGTTLTISSCSIKLTPSK